MRQEAGFEHEGSDEETDDVSSMTPMKRKATDKKIKLEEMMEESGRNIASLVATVKNRLDNSHDFEEMDAIAKINEQKRKLDDDVDFGPEIKKKMHEALSRKKHYYARKLIEK